MHIRTILTSLSTVSINGTALFADHGSTLGSRVSSSSFVYLSRKAYKRRRAWKNTNSSITQVQYGDRILARLTWTCIKGRIKRQRNECEGATIRFLKVDEPSSYCTSYHLYTSYNLSSTVNKRSRCKLYRFTMRLPTVDLA